MSLSTRAAAHVRGRGSAIVVAAVLALATAVGLGVAPTSAVIRTPYNTNLVRNPGFEAGAASDGSYPVAVPGWTTCCLAGGTTGVTVVRYGAPGGFPTAAEGVRISGAQKFLTFGNPEQSSCSAAKQTLTIRGRNGDIDSDRVVLLVTAKMGTFDHQPDTAVLGIHTSGATQFPIHRLSLSATNTNGMLVTRSGAFPLAFGTRKVHIELNASNTVGYCDAYFDKISVKLIYI